MKTIIGLGKAGCSTARLFKGNMYNVQTIDTSNADVLIEEVDTIEAYEKAAASMSSLTTEDEVYFILAGGGKIAGASLSILEKIKDKKITVVYIKPDTGLLNHHEKLSERLIYKVLQEFVRSGMIHGLVLASNSHIEKQLGGIGFNDYYHAINERIAKTLQMCDYLSQAKSIIGELREPSDYSRIGTIGVREGGKDYLLFPIDLIREKRYLYAIPEEKLATHKTLLSEIKEVLEVGKEAIKISYKVVSTTYKDTQVFVQCYSNKIQD